MNKIWPISYIRRYKDNLFKNQHDSLLATKLKIFLCRQLLEKVQDQDQNYVGSWANQGTELS